MSKATEIDLTFGEEEDSRDYKALLEQSMKEFNEQFGQKAKQKSKKQPISTDKKKYENLLLKLERQDRQIEELEEENRLLKAEIARCEDKIRAYPQTKRRYDQLTESLSRAHEYQTTTKRAKK